MLSLKKSHSRFHTVVLGDSLSLPRPWRKNAPADNPELFTRYEETYPCILQDKIVSSVPSDSPVPFISVMSKRSATSKDAALLAEDAIFWRSPTILIYQFGIVDCWPRGKNGEALIDLPEFDRNLNIFFSVREKYSPNLPIVILGISPPNSKSALVFPDLMSRVSEYNAILKSRASTSVHYIDVDGLLRKYTDYFLHPDGHHLSRYGHKVIAEKVWSSIACLCANKLYG